MQIATYVVIEPSSKDDLLRHILQGIAAISEVRLTIEAIDTADHDIEEIDFAIRQSFHDGLGYHHFGGVSLIQEGGELLRFIINVTIPSWDESATVKIARDTE